MSIEKAKIGKNGLVVKPLISKELNFRGQLDLDDMQSLAYNDYKFIMVYQDYMTNFLVLKPLKSKKATEVVMQILDIFLLFGAYVRVTMGLNLLLLSYLI